MFLSIEEMEGLLYEQHLHDYNRWLSGYTRIIVWMVSNLNNIVDSIMEKFTCWGLRCFKEECLYQEVSR